MFLYRDLLVAISRHPLWILETVYQNRPFSQVKYTCRIGKKFHTRWLWEIDANDQEKANGHQSSQSPSSTKRDSRWFSLGFGLGNDIFYLVCPSRICLFITVFFQIENATKSVSIFQSTHCFPNLLWNFSFTWWLY